MFRVTARLYGNTVEFFVDSGDVKAALAVAKVEANRVFDYKGIGDEPKVYVREVVEKG